MNNWKKYALVAVMVTAAGFAYFTSPNRNIPSDFRDAAGEEKERDFNLQGINVKDVKYKKVFKTPVVAKPQVVETNTDSIDWVVIPGGKFTMGTDSLEDAKPVHEVNIRTFEMSKTEVTVKQYGECTSKGQCTKPKRGAACNWGKTARESYPVNCVSWHQAIDYARFKGARLPSESEWEYAAKSGGKNQKYPWGDEEATCYKAVIHSNYIASTIAELGLCGNEGTRPVCSRTAGNTAQGLCDMAGNVWEWVQDNYEKSYKEAPADGRAFEYDGPLRVTRGGSVYYSAGKCLRADYRQNDSSHNTGFGLGFRIARSR